MILIAKYWTWILYRWYGTLIVAYMTLGSPTFGWGSPKLHIKLVSRLSTISNSCNLVTWVVKMILQRLLGISKWLVQS